MIEGCILRTSVFVEEDHLCNIQKQFQCLEAHLMHIGIESLHPLGLEYRREFCDSVSIVYKKIWIKYMIC